MKTIKIIKHYIGLTIIALMASSPVHAVITDLAEELLGISSELKVQLLRLPPEMQCELISQIKNIPALEELGHGIVRSQQILADHSGELFSAAYSPDGNHIVTAFATAPHAYGMLTQEPLNIPWRGTHLRLNQQHTALMAII